MLHNLDTIYYIPRSSKNFSTEINFSENIFLVYRGLFCIKLGTIGVLLRYFYSPKDL